VLKDKQFEIRERGEIQVKGKGLMTTYFLLQNLVLSEEQIMGQGEELCLYRDDHKELDQATDDVREVEEERKSPSKEQSSSSSPYLISDDPSPVPSADDTFTCAADSPHHHVLHYVPDYSEPVENGLPSENAINSRLCMLL
ncbi:guanylate cyclase soluble subunit beta-2, partial [Tachysurus ichikawai]